MRASSILIPAFGLVTAVVLAAPSCGKSPLARSYEAYADRVEPLLDREIPVWRKLAILVNEQGKDTTPDFDRFADVLRRESVPFYEGFRDEVGKLDPGDPALAPAQAALERFAKARVEFVHVLADNIEALRVGDPSSKLLVKDNVLESAMADYSRTLKDGPASGDTRFSELIQLQTAFQTQCIEPLSEGRATAEDVKDRIAKRILPKIRSLRATQFGDDEPSRLLRNAIAASEEFFDAVVENLPRMEAGARLKRSSSALDKEGEDALKKFREEMKSVRGRK